jgi:ribosomal protein S18 acetylase RimI-like enzyme
MHRRDLNKTWEFVKLVFRDVNRETVEYQRPRTKRRFAEVYDQEGIEQLLFETEAGDVVGYAECAFDASGEDNWINPRYFDKRGMRPMFVEELAVHPDYQGRGVGSFIIDQLQHLARVRGCTHLVLEVAENNETALSWYRRRNFFKLDAAIFMAQKVAAEPELLPPRKIPARRVDEDGSGKTLSLPARTAARTRGSTKAKAAGRRVAKLVVAADPPPDAGPTEAAPTEAGSAAKPSRPRRAASGRGRSAEPLALVANPPAVSKA